jgi:predicted acetyltransferase
MANNQEVKEQMFSSIQQWENSHQSQKAFCLEHNIRYYVFHYWLKRYREGREGKKDTPTSFVKLEVASSAILAHAELVLPDGKRLLFHEPVSSGFLKSLIS